MSDYSSSNSQQRFWGIDLNIGVGGKNMCGFYLSCFTAIMLATFVPATQPFLLSEVLHIDKDNQGVISGNLNFWGEIVIILSVGLIGSLSDRLGRRLVTTASYAIAAIGIGLYGLAESIGQLYFARCVYSLGIAGISTMIVTLMADYAADNSRGKATGFLGIMNGLGAMVAALVLVKLPAIYQGQGFNAEQAGFATFACIGLLTLIVAVLIFLTLKPGVAIQNEQKKSVFKQIEEGFTAAKDPGISLAYAASFVARGNLAVVGTFFTLWASIYGTQELGMSSAEALAKGGGLVAISYVASLLSAPIFGILTDKVRRVDAVAITMLVAVIGYGGTFFVSVPFSWQMIVCLIFIGMAEVGCIITSGVLIAQQSPARVRGSTIGVFTFCGAVGILVASIVGGQLFDHWLKSGPFVFFGGAAGVVLIWALFVRTKITPPPAGD